MAYKGSLLINPVEFDGFRNMSIITYGSDEEF
jgi:hypothetical protein